MKKDIFINFIITFLIGITLFLSNKYFAFYLGQETLGIMKLFTQLLAYLNIAEIGLASASAYALYKPLVEKKSVEISIILNTMTFLYNKIFLFILIMGLLLTPIIPFFIKNKISSAVYLYWVLYVISTSLNYLFIKYSILFTADQKYRFVRIVEGGSKVFCQLLQIFVIVKYHSFLVFICILILNNLIQYVVYKYYYKINYGYIIKINKKKETIINNLKNLIWHKLAALIVFNTDLILISKFISLEIVGIYASYQMIIQMVVTLLVVVLNVLKPRVGKFIAVNNNNRIYEKFKKINIFFLFLSVNLTFCTYKLINKFIILWVGKSFLLTNMTVILIIINLFIQSFRGVLEIFKETYGFFDDVYLPISEAIINFIVSVVLVQYIGLNGVIIGTIFSNILIICIAKPIFVFKRCFNKTITDFVSLYSIYLYLIATSFVILNFIFSLLRLDNFYSWEYFILQAFSVLILSIIITFIIFLFSKDFRNFLSFINIKNFNIKKSSF